MVLYLAMRSWCFRRSRKAWVVGCDNGPFPTMGYVINVWNYAAKPVLGTNTVVNMFHLIQSGTLQLIIDCGTEDFLEVNQQLQSAIVVQEYPSRLYYKTRANTTGTMGPMPKYQFLFMSEFLKQSWKKISIFVFIDTAAGSARVFTGCLQQPYGCSKNNRKDRGLETKWWKDKPSATAGTKDTARAEG